jgi:hypothetical protein
MSPSSPITGPLECPGLPEAFGDKQAKVAQAGVQRMSSDTSGLSALNVLECFFWFKSRMATTPIDCPALQHHCGHALAPRSA